MKLIHLVLAVTVTTIFLFITNTSALTLEKTNNLMLSFFDPIFNFMKDLFFRVLDFFGKLFVGG